MEALESRSPHESLYLGGFDLMRVVAMSGVVGMHVSAYTLAQSLLLIDPQALSLPSYWILAAINQFGRFAVPAFYFMAGYLITYNHGQRLVNDRGTYVNTLRKRWRNVLLPYVMWALMLNIFFWLGQGAIDWVTALKRIVAGETVYHLHFFRHYAVNILLLPIFLYVMRRWPRLFWVAVGAQRVFKSRGEYDLPGHENDYPSNVSMG